MTPWSDILPAWFVLTVAFIFGTLVGSFVNVLIYRLPEGESVVTPPSRCPSCGHQLGGLDLVPIFSFLVAGRKCRYCRAPISWQYLTIELLTGLVFMAVVWRFVIHAGSFPPVGGLTDEVTGAAAGGIFGVYVNAILLCAWLATLIASFVIDMRHFIIPDELNYAGIAIGFLRAIAGHHTEMFGFWGPKHIGTAPTTVEAVVGIVGLAGFLWLMMKGGTLLFRKQIAEQQRQWDEEGLLEEGEQLEAMGLGDVKLAAAMGANLGLVGGFVGLFIAVGVGAVAGILMKLSRRLEGHAIPFGPYLILGSAVSLFWGTDLIHWYLGRLGR